MLEEYFVKPSTIDRLRGSWIAAEIETYVAWLAGQGYSTKSIWRRVPIGFAFGEFARERGSAVTSPSCRHTSRRSWPTGSPPTMRRPARRGRWRRKSEARSSRCSRSCSPASSRPAGAHHPLPFADAVPGFFGYLDEERGLRPASIYQYRHHLDRFEAYLARIGVRSLGELSPPILSAYIVERASAGLAKSTVRDSAGVLRVFLRYAHREGVLASDLSGAVGWPQIYRLSAIPRSISWDDVNRVLASVDRRTAAGRRDYAILLLLVTYGLRGREVAALTLDDIDWKRERLAIPERKAGHSTAFPLSAVVGEALVDYLRHGRPQTADRHVFFRAAAPRQPIGTAAVSALARSYLLKAGVDVPRPGSHTLRHSAVQRLVDADFPLKTIGDFIGHRSARSTEVYAKVAVEALRQVALGDGEEVLS